MSPKQDQHPAISNEHKKSSKTGDALQGLVIVNYGKQLILEDQTGELRRCVMRRSLGRIVCGDRVTWSAISADEGVVEELLPRDNVLTRVINTGNARPLAANIDQIIIVAAAEPAPEPFLIDKYTVAAELTHIEPLLVINKVDLLDTPARAEIDRLLEEYRDIGYRTLYTSALENTGIEAFAERLAGHTSILVGQSGVGKSSLVMRLLPDLEISIGKLSDASRFGKHTTTATTLYSLPDGGRLIDSPGVRDFKLEVTEPERLMTGFREFSPLINKCRFNNCRHMSEPGCAITAGAQDGIISNRRLESYRNLVKIFGNKS
jgi:ribosome biogenesis GTPase